MNCEPCAQARARTRAACSACCGASTTTWRAVLTSTLRGFSLLYVLSTLTSLLRAVLLSVYRRRRAACFRRGALSTNVRCTLGRAHARPRGTTQVAMVIKANAGSLTTQTHIYEMTSIYLYLSSI